MPRSEANIRLLSLATVTWVAGHVL